MASSTSAAEKDLNFHSFSKYVKPLIVTDEGKRPPSADDISERDTDDEQTAVRQRELTVYCNDGGAYVSKNKLKNEGEKETKRNGGKEKQGCDFNNSGTDELNGPLREGTFKAIKTLDSAFGST